MIKINTKIRYNEEYKRLFSHEKDLNKTFIVTNIVKVPDTVNEDGFMIRKMYSRQDFCKYLNIATLNNGKTINVDWLIEV